MTASPRLALGAGQALSLTPALLQSIRLLALSARDLAVLVERELQENPFLRREAESDAAGPAQAGTAKPCAAAGAGFPLPSLPGGTAMRAGAPCDAAEALPGAEGLHRHLAGQVELAVRAAPERRIAAHLLEMLSEAGYVEGDLAALAARLGVPRAAVETVLGKLQQSCEPTGLFARDLAECLALQLAERGRLDEPMRRLLRHLDLLARRDFARLEQICGVERSKLAAMAAELRSLDPKPGAGLSGAPVPAVLPDLLVEAGPDGAWSVAVNPALLPRLALDRDYRREVRKAGMAPAERAWLEERFTAADGLLRALERRARTLLEVGAALVRRQDAFLRRGRQGLKPLTRRALALELGLHESTVGRIVAGKFIATPQGLLPLSVFFGPALAVAPGAEAPGTPADPPAAAAVRERLRALLRGEPPEAPLSDAALAARLRREGIALSRRTVAKYREMLRIPDSRRRSARGLSKA